MLPVYLPDTVVVGANRKSAAVTHTGACGEISDVFSSHELPAMSASKSALWGR